MKALAYEKAHPLEAFAIELTDVPDPRPRDGDVVVDVRAIGIKGPGVTGFTAGDRVMGTGDITRDGSWAERVALDHRVVAKIPDHRRRGRRQPGEDPRPGGRRCRRGLLRPIVTRTLEGLTAETMKAAHTLAESGRTIGKTVIAA